MVASSLDGSTEAGPASEDPGLGERQAFRGGPSFNGNQRSRVFFGAGDGSFSDLSHFSGVDSTLDGRAALAVDFDDDGDLDLFVHNVQNRRHELFRNDQDHRGGAGFLKIHLRATSGQYEAVGATVKVSSSTGTVAQVLSRGSGFLSCLPPELVFGLGQASEASVRVFWPGGLVEDFGTVAANSKVLLVEGSGQIEQLELSPHSLRDPLPAGLKIGIGDRVPRLTLVDGSGVTRTIDVVELAGGETLYLNFWASYCRPCLEEIPALERMHAEPGRRVVAISVDVPADRRDALAALESRGASYPCFFLSMADEDNEAGFDELIDLLRLPVPTTLELDPDGRLRSVGPTLR